MSILLLLPVSPGIPRQKLDTPFFLFSVAYRRPCDKSPRRNVIVHGLSPASSISIARMRHSTSFSAVASTRAGEYAFLPSPFSIVQAVPSLLGSRAPCAFQCDFFLFPLINSSLEDSRSSPALIAAKGLRDGGENAPLPSSGAIGRQCSASSSPYGMHEGIGACVPQIPQFLPSSFPRISMRPCSRRYPLLAPLFFPRRIAPRVPRVGLIVSVNSKNVLSSLFLFQKCTETDCCFSFLPFFGGIITGDTVIHFLPSSPFLHIVGFKR